MDRVEKESHRDLTRYAFHPRAYARQVLGVRLWKSQLAILRAVHRPPYKVLCKASHSVGKTFLCAVLTSYWFDVFPDSSVVITTAPTSRDVKDLLWTEIRALRGTANLGGFRGNSAPELWEHHNHFAKGFTAEYSESFQGRHRKHMLFIFDESIRIASDFWTTTKTMFKPDGGLHAWVVIGNPTDTSTQMYDEDQSGNWTTFEMSSLDHPNLKAELLGKPQPYPTAVSLSQFEAWLKDWCDPVPDDDHDECDLFWPPQKTCACCGGSGQVPEKDTGESNA
jgi:hypothetical protein